MVTRNARRRIATIAAAIAVVAATTITLIVTSRYHESPPVAVDQCTCPGYKTCATDPDNCDGGDRLPGGDIVVAVGKSPRGWNPGSILGGVGDTAEELTP